MYGVVIWYVGRSHDLQSKWTTLSDSPYPVELYSLLKGMNYANSRVRSSGKIDIGIRVRYAVKMSRRIYDYDSAIGRSPWTPFNLFKSHVYEP